MKQPLYCPTFYFLFSIQFAFFFQGKAHRAAILSITIQITFKHLIYDEPTRPIQYKLINITNTIIIMYRNNNVIICCIPKSSLTATPSAERLRRSRDSLVPWKTWADFYPRLSQKIRKRMYCRGAFRCLPALVKHSCQSKFKATRRRNDARRSRATFNHTTHY